MSACKYQSGKLCLPLCPLSYVYVNVRTFVVLSVHKFWLCCDAVRRACKKFGFRVVEEGSEAILYWSDCSVSIDRAAELKPYQVCARMVIGECTFDG